MVINGGNMRSSNPIFSKDLNISNSYTLSERTMSISGTMGKLVLLSTIMLIAAAAVFYQFSLGRLDLVNIITIPSAIIGLILGLIISFKPKTAPYLSPIYAFLEGIVLSSASCFFEAQYRGIVSQAATITILTVFVMAAVVFIGKINLSSKFYSILFIAGLSVTVFYSISLILMLFHIPVSYFSSNSTLAIVINVVIALIAALYLIGDFNSIRVGSENNYPAIYEWYYSFGLLVTIVWLYLEILRLLARLMSRNSD